MKLYEVPQETNVRVISEEAVIPPAAPIISAGEVIKFHHIDGMYSFCHDSAGKIVHLAAWEEVEIVDA